MGLVDKATSNLQTRHSMECMRDDLCAWAKAENSCLKLVVLVVRGEERASKRWN